MFKVRRFIIIISLLLLGPPVFAQNGVLKLNVSALVFQNISFSYEHILNKNKTVALTVGWMPKHDVPNIITNRMGNPDIADDLVDLSKYTGINIIPEIRFYRRGLKEPLKGLYLAPFICYTNYPISSDYQYDSTIIQIRGKFKQVGFGLTLGVQWMLADRIFIDWYFFGPSFARSGFNFIANSSDPSYDVEGVFIDIMNTIDVPVGKLTSKIVGTTVVVDYEVSTPILRTGISIGYLF